MVGGQNLTHASIILTVKNMTIFATTSLKTQANFNLISYTISCDVILG